MNLKAAVRILLLILATNIQISSEAQSQTSNVQLYDDVARDMQLNGKVNQLLSFCVHPLYNVSLLSIDSVYRHQQNNTAANYFDSNNNSKNIFLLPLELKQQFNSHHPYGWNDGSMIPAKGYQTQLSFGLLLKKGIVSLQLRPEIVFAQNQDFPGFSSHQSDSIWRSYYYTVLNKIDAPELLSSGPYFKIFPGQSSLRFNYHKLSFGFSTENLWWGPGVRNSLLMSSNAPGFPHLSYNSLQPVNSPIGSFEWQLISGKLQSSNMFPDTSRKFNGQYLYQPKPNGDRYLNGVVVAWQPKWTKGLFVGFSRVFYEYMSDVEPSFNG